MKVPLSNLETRPKSIWGTGQADKGFDIIREKYAELQQKFEQLREEFMVVLDGTHLGDIVLSSVDPTQQKLLTHFHAYNRGFTNVIKRTDIGAVSKERRQLWLPTRNPRTRTLTTKVVLLLTSPYQKIFLRNRSCGLGGGQRDDVQLDINKKIKTWQKL
ncbi:Hypothetical predicted protein [Mytilus galloprovincialis]|uniref:Uncharacterized protein n=1 Tax=Mytilus galloprovincialis TaxID=29158 RepID=A0A8B6CKZ4_MYTGA|nr:Hypothetical predicted protein [Mytilus galloprovincialis]